MSPSEPASEDLSLLQLIDRLEVGPVRTEPRRLVAPYTIIHQNGRSDSCELVYRYEEDVFGLAGDPAEENLTALIAAQVAVNYGLFCREIVFHGPFDAADRTFLTEMAALAARDVYVRKLLRPKPFFTSWVAQVPVVRLESYLLAQLRFPDAASAAAAPAWEVSESRTAVLSSGGKDSLLSHQILAELGQETHPVFVNESGKHWFTALNAYRHYAARVPNTARVWTSSDRVFAWLLRHLPFVKPGYTRHNWPGYPIRVWTVPVFLFGILPLLKKRGIGRLVTGNELDTTVRSSHEGIQHYFCLYDQSRYFDLYLGEYFRRKGWNVRPFSILRPLSGLLIQKQLLRRYPEMLRLQTSCHRAHPAGGRMWPCGRCEKCVGVMAVLTAFGGDPAACGYSPGQVERCLRELPQQGTWQEPYALEHLAFLLHEKGVLPAAMVGSYRAARHSEMMKLRFDGDASDLGDVPEDLRYPLFRLLLEHAEGAVTAVNDEWIDFDPCSV
ncbi:MAG TPA: hypothetical protein VF173_34590 [Thermoanaerobaculia bacterium]|nr:hypothetical protein [Thermoanaerobaculia bacterium]